MVLICSVNLLMSVNAERRTLRAAKAVDVSSGGISRKMYSVATVSACAFSAACFSSMACASRTRSAGSPCALSSCSFKSSLQSMMRKSLSAAKSIRKRNICGLSSSSFLSTATQRTLSTNMGRTQLE